jgi:hypothetical protein
MSYRFKVDDLAVSFECFECCKAIQIVKIKEK